MSHTIGESELIASIGLVLLGSGIHLTDVSNSLFQTSSMASGHHGDSWTNKPAMRDSRVFPLSDH